MDTNALLLTLCSQITPVERSALRNNNVAHISQHNRNTLLHMLEMEEQNPVPVDTARAKALHAALRDYLNRYMPETPEAHKWIIIACLYLALVAGVPMHPKDIVGWEKMNDKYICPSQEEGGVYQWCVCR